MAGLYKNNKMKYLNILFLILFLTNIFLIFAQKTDSSKITLITDKTGYFYKEIVILSISNISNDTLYIYRQSITYESLELEKKENNKWITVDIIFPFNGILVIEPFMPEEKFIFEWDQTINKKKNWPERKISPIGKYRFKITYWDKNEIRYPVKNGNKNQFMEYFINYSNEFVL